MLKLGKILIPARRGHGKEDLLDLKVARRQLLAEELCHGLGVEAIVVAAPSAQHELLATQLIADGKDKADAIAQRVQQGIVAHAVLLASTLDVGRGGNDHVGVRMHVVAVEAHRRHHQRAVAVELAVDVAATVLAVPLTLLIEHIVQIRIGAERGLLAQIALDIAATRIGKRGKGEHGHIAELRIAATIIEDGLRGGSVEHGDLGQDRSGLLGRRRLGFGDFLGRLLDGLGCHLGLNRSLYLGGLRLLGNRPLSSRSRLGLGLHRRDKADRHTVELTHAGKRALDILGTSLGHGRHMTLGGLSASLTLRVRLSRAVGPAVTVPVVDVCHKWSPFLSLPLSAFPIHDTPPRIKKAAPKDRLSHRFTAPDKSHARHRTSRDDRGCSGCAGTR